MELYQLSKGDRIELHPATDLWVRGARYGDVTSVGRSKVSVKMDRLVRIIRVDPRNILKVIATGTFAGCLVLSLLANQADARGSGGSRLGRGHSHVSTSVHTSNNSGPSGGHGRGRL